MDTMKDYKTEALIDAGVEKLPKKWVKGTNFIKAIGLVERVSGAKQYVLLKQVGRKHLVSKDYCNTPISRVVSVHPYEFRVKTKAEAKIDIKTIKTKADYLAWLQAANLDPTPYGSMTKEELKELIETII